jgi:Enolase C-terminal domain-like
MARAMGNADVTWFEEPVSSDDLDGLREVRDQVAADVAAGHRLQVSGHCAPNPHVQAAVAVPNLRHLEYFHDHVRIEGCRPGGPASARWRRLILLAFVTYSFAYADGTTTERKTIGYHRTHTE